MESEMGSPSTRDMSLKPILPDPGSAKDPADFVGRKATTEYARRALIRGRNLALTDPRRMGKSYWIEHFCAITTDFVPVKIDYEGVTTTDTFLTRTAEALGRHDKIADRAKTAMRALFDNVAEIGAGPIRIKPGVVALTPPRLLRDTVMSVSDSAGDKPVLVCMDEVPAAILNITQCQGPLEARSVLQTLRNLRREAVNIRWIISGSVGFHHVLRHCHSTEGEINDLENLPLGPLTTDEAGELVRRLLLGIARPNVGDDAIEELIRCTGAIPYLIQHMANLLDTSPPEVIDPQTVQRLFNEFIRDRDASRAATHLVSRVEQYYGEYEHPANLILDAVAVSVEPVPFDDFGNLATTPREEPLDRSALLGIAGWLVDDHYLNDGPAGYTWRYDVLRSIWAHRRKLGR